MFLPGAFIYKVGGVKNENIAPMLQKWKASRRTCKKKEIEKKGMKNKKRHDVVRIAGMTAM